MTARSTSIPTVRKAILAPTSPTVVRPGRVYIPLSMGLITPKIGLLGGLGKAIYAILNDVGFGTAGSGGRI